MREDYGNMALVTNDDGFGDMGFDTDAPDLMRHATGLEPSIEQVYNLIRKNNYHIFTFFFFVEQSVI